MRSKINDWPMFNTPPALRGRTVNPSCETYICPYEKVDNNVPCMVKVVCPFNPNHFPKPGVHSERVQPIVDKDLDTLTGSVAATI